MAKRRHFSREFKAQVVLDVLTGVQSQEGDRPTSQSIS